MSAVLCRPNTSDHVAQWRCPIPGEFNPQPLPMIAVHAATEREFSTDPDFDRFQTCIWFRSARGRISARRLARDLAETGVAVVYPSDRDIAILSGERHQIIEIGKAPEPRLDDADEEGHDE